MFLRTLFLISLISVCYCENDRPEVKTPLGKVRGYYKTANGGRKVSAFEGIPYAKPPIGERRFQAPEPAEPWSGTWDAIFVSECVQTGMLKLATIQGEEDCLYVNVYVPREHPDPLEKLDVIVHIHGGLYMYGSAHSYAHPEFLMDKDIIFVTFNYRLGLFGFLSTEDDVVSGNNGLKDQVLALQWIQKNIASFGGNPESVTLTGLSAGASSVHLHYLSDKSKGLFQKGFSQSGTALNPWSLQEGALAKAQALATSVGCPSGYSQVFIQCLKQRHFKHLISKMHLFYGYEFTPFSPFGPVIEKGSDPFLNKSPYELLVKGKVQDLPWIVSTTAHEGMLPEAYLYKNLKEVNKDWNKIAPFLLDYNYTLSQSEWGSTAKKIKKFYLGEEDISAKNHLKLVQLFSDRLFLVDAEISAKLQAKANKSPVYFYNFWFPGSTHDQPVSHADDAQYIFFNMFKKRSLSPSDLKMKDVMLDMLVSFAKTGKPTISDVTWEPTSHEELTFLKIYSYKPEAIHLKTVKELAPLDFWKSLGLRENENLVQVKDEL